MRGPMSGGSRQAQHVPWAALVLMTGAEWRARWRSCLVLVAFSAVTVGAVVATLSAATRSDSAFDRLRASTRASDAIIASFDPASDPAAAAAKVDGVEGAESFAALFV